MSSAPSKTVSILLVDDHELVRDGLILLLESRAGFRIVGDAEKSSEVTGLVMRERPDIILLDVGLAGHDGLALIPEITRVSPASKIIILTGSSDRKTHQRAARLGASGLVLKEK